MPGPKNHAWADSCWAGEGLGLAAMDVHQVTQANHTKQRRGIVRSEIRCRHYILGLLYSACLRLGSQNLTHNPCPPIVVDCTMYTAQWTLSQIPDSRFELAEYIKPKIQWRHLFADLTIHTSSLIPSHLLLCIGYTVCWYSVCQSVWDCRVYALWNA